MSDAISRPRGFKTKIIHQVDRRIMLWAWIMFCALDLHRRNINRAISDNMVRTQRDINTLGRGVFTNAL